MSMQEGHSARENFIMLTIIQLFVIGCINWCASISHMPHPSYQWTSGRGYISLDLEPWIYWIILI